MDGNGRWAEQKGLPRVEGHSAGVEAVRIVVDCCLNAKVPVLSLFAFSSENWLRPDAEVDFLMKLFLQVLKQEMQALHENGVKVCFTGDRTDLSALLCEQMESIEKLTINNANLVLNLALNYGGKWEIAQAAKTIAIKVQNKQLSPEQINEGLLNQYLCTYNLPDPDLFIRTSGEQRISNFFLWQLAYTELYFTDTHWPDFTKEEFEKALSSFRKRQRRYGKTAHQLEEVLYV
jgi:undecaprenyl diphosphate synthase